MQSDVVEDEAQHFPLPYILTPQQAHDVLTSSDSSPPFSGRTVPICAAWFWAGDPQVPRDLTGLDAFTTNHIPHSLFWDFEAITDSDSQLPHMVPSAACLASAINALGIVRADRLIIYDSAELGLFTAPRVAWLLRTFGYPNVHILDNFRLWLQQGLPVESGPPPPALEKPAQLQSPDGRPVESWPGRAVATFDDIRSLSQAMGANSADAQLIDARFESMFYGQEPDLFPGIPSGHVPNAINVPWNQICDPDSKTLRSADELSTLFKDCGVSRELPAVTMCHVGIAAGVLDAALEKAGFGGKMESRKIFDGSYVWVSSLMIHF